MIFLFFFFSGLFTLLLEDFGKQNFFFFKKVFSIPCNLFFFLSDFLVKRFKYILVPPSNHEVTN